MAQIIRTWWPVFIALFLIQTGNGLTGSLISIAGQADGLDPWLKGFVLSAFFVGSIAGAFSAPAVIARTSHVHSFIIYASALSLTTAGFAANTDPLFWIALRLVAGAAITGMFTTVESWLNLSSQDAWRARVFSIYIFVQLAGLTAGQLLINARGVGNVTLFLIAGTLTLLSILTMRFEQVSNPKLETTHRLAILDLARRAPLGVLCVSLAGFAWAGLMASGPAMTQMQGFSDFEKSMFMALAVIGGMLAQIPVGWFADHHDRRWVLVALTVSGATIALLTAWMQMPVLTYAFAFIFGAATLPLYAVGVARINEVLAQSERTSASAGMIAFFEFGAILAPVISAVAMDNSGPTAFFVVLAVPQALFAVFALSAIHRARTHPS